MHQKILREFLQLKDCWTNFFLKKLNFINKGKILTYKTSKFDKLASSWGICPLKILFDKFLYFK